MIGMRVEVIKYFKDTKVFDAFYDRRLERTIKLIGK